MKKCIELGITHFDTANMYSNELEIGNAIKELKLDRKTLFLKTKVSPEDMEYNKVLNSV